MSENPNIPLAELPGQARIVIIGGGIIGCSTAYHLAKMGCDDVVLLEQHKLTSGSTFHAAGLVGQLRTNANITQLLGYSVELYKTLEQETGLATGWKMNGGLRLACNEARWTEVKRQATTAHSFGLDMHLLTPQEALDLWPVMDIEDLVGAAFLPTDGQVNPSDITQSLASGARKGGVQICEDTEVSGFDFDDNKIRAVHTNNGTIKCERLVICGGQWSHHLGQLAGVNIPLVSVQHQYLVTDKVALVTAELPTLRDPDRLTYFKEEVGGLVMGGYEPNPIPWAQDGIPEGFNYTLLDNDWDHFEPLLEQAIARVPSLADAGIKQMLNGPESFTPDGNFILGEAPERKNVFVGAGFNAFGIASGGGAGMALAEWTLKGEPPFDLWPVDIRRFGQPHKDIEWVRKRTLEAYSKHYTMAWPHEENKSCRPCRRSPLYDSLISQGACFGEKLGWERPNWFADNPAAAVDEYSFERQNWFEAVGLEHQAVRERVAVFDQSSFAKYRVTGVDAEAALSWICANNIDAPVGAVVYTQMLNQRGGIECDLTVNRVGEQEFYLVTGTGFATHDLDWIRSNIPADCDARIEDVTSAWAVLSLMGPNAREVLQPLVRDDISNAAFPFGRMHELAICGAMVRALRVSYVGELGWELHIPVEFAVTIYQELMSAGKEHGIVNAGYRAIESLRLEKAYRAWGADIGPDYSPLEAGLGWAVDLKSGKSFIGREAILAQKEQPLVKSLACFTLPGRDVVLLGRETIYRDNERVGWLSSAGWGYTANANIGLGYVRNASGVDKDYLLAGTYELEVAGERLPCEIQFQALYDPSGPHNRMRARTMKVGGKPIFAGRNLKFPALALNYWMAVVALVIITLGVMREAYIGTFGLDTPFKDLGQIALDSEGTLAVWFSSLVMTASAAMLFTISALARKTDDHLWSRWMILGILFVLMSIDETVSIHEITMTPLRNTLGLGGILHFSWVVIASPLVIGLGLYFLPFLLSLPFKFAAAFAASGILYVGGALGMEFVGGYAWTTFGATSIEYTTAFLIEESLELIGLTCFFAALVYYLRTQLSGKALNLMLGEQVKPT